MSFASEPEPDPSASPRNQRPNTVGHTAFRFARDGAISAAIALIFVLFLYQPVKVEGYSMMPRLENSERIFINKFAYRFENIERGDVVVFWYPLDPAKSFIKRVIAVGGDRVKIVDGVVYLNGEKLDEPYVVTTYRDHANFPEIVVPPHHYFVLGDHRNSSNDSRSWGCVGRRYIYGKAVFAYWPMDRLGLVE
jgi:signal peptidase I